MARKVSDKIFICGSCEKPKRKSSFYPEPSRAHGISSRCIKCDQEKNRALYKQNAEQRKAYRIRYKARRRELHLEQKWGMSISEYGAMCRAQNGLCAICGKAPLKRQLAVDHDHATGAIRGLLCDSCNLGIGYFNDDPELMLAAIDYINQSRNQMQNAKIKIIIEGDAGSGKTTVASVLSKALSKLGYNVSYQQNELSKHDAEAVLERASAFIVSTDSLHREVAQHTSVAIHERQTGKR